MFLTTALFKISKSITEGIKTRDEAVSNCKANPVKNETKINDFKSKYLNKNKKEFLLNEKKLAKVLASKSIQTNFICFEKIPAKISAKIIIPTIINCTHQTFTNAIILIKKFAIKRGTL